MEHPAGTAGSCVHKDPTATVSCDVQQLQTGRSPVRHQRRPQVEAPAAELFAIRNTSKCQAVHVTPNVTFQRASVRARWCHVKLCASMSSHVAPTFTVLRRNRLILPCSTQSLPRTMMVRLTNSGRMVTMQPQVHDVIASRSM
jgi:hypothetical protein